MCCWRTRYHSIEALWTDYETYARQIRQRFDQIFDEAGVNNGGAPKG